MSDRSLVRLNFELAAAAEEQHLAAERRAAALLEEARQLERAATEKIQRDQQAVRAAEQRRKARLALEATNLATAERRAAFDLVADQQQIHGPMRDRLRTRLGIKGAGQ